MITTITANCSRLCRRGVSDYKNTDISFRKGCKRFFGRRAATRNAFPKTAHRSSQRPRRPQMFFFSLPLLCPTDLICSNCGCKFADANDPTQQLCASHFHSQVSSDDPLSSDQELPQMREDANKTNRRLSIARNAVLGLVLLVWGSLFVGIGVYYIFWIISGVETWDCWRHLGLAS